MARQEYEVDGGSVLETLTESRVVVADEHGKTLCELPLWVVILLAVLATPVVVIGAIVAIACRWKLRWVNGKPEPPPIPDRDQA